MKNRSQVGMLMHEIEGKNKVKVNGRQEEDGDETEHGWNH